MTIENESERLFLIELYHTTQGDLSAKTTMQEVGATVGLDKEQAGKTAENLIGYGYVEIKSLSGGIGITTDGIEAARNEGASPIGGNSLNLGAGPFLDGDDRQVLETLLAEIKQSVAGLQTNYEQLEVLVVDIKTIEVHLLSPKPKTVIVVEILRALKDALEIAQAKDIAGRIGVIIG